MAQVQAQPASLTMLGKPQDSVKVSEVPVHEHDCDSPIHGRVYELLSFYKLHTDTIQHLVHDYETEVKCHKEDEQRALELRGKLVATEDALKKSKKANDESQHELERLETELKKTTRELANTLKQLDVNKKELDSTKKSLATTENDLKSTRDQLAEKEKDLDSKKKDLADSGKMINSFSLEVTQQKSSNAKLQEDLNKANRYIESLKSQNNELTNQVKIADLSEDSAAKKAAALETEKDKIKEELNKVNRAYAELQYSGSNGFLDKQGRKSLNNKYYIDEVIYGGKVVESPKVISDLLALAEAGKAFTINNRLMGGDPWHYTTKSLTVAYTVDGKGPLRYICQRENEQALFETK